MATKKKAGKKTGNRKGGKKKAGSKKKGASKAKTSSKNTKSSTSASSPGLLQRAQNFVSEVLGGATQTATGAIEGAADTGKEAASMGQTK